MKSKTCAPNALICSECFESQRKARVSSEDEFYCEHHHVWAIRRPDGGWLLSTDVSPEDHRALLEDARRLQTLDDCPVSEPSASIVH